MVYGGCECVLIGLMPDFISQDLLVSTIKSTVRMCEA